MVDDSRDNINKINNRDSNFPPIHLCEDYTSVNTLPLSPHNTDMSAMGGRGGSDEKFYISDDDNGVPYINKYS